MVADPPALQSQNGVLEVTMSFNTVTDSQGLVRYCYVAGAGQQAPTLLVDPGDKLIIHFTNNLPMPAQPRLSGAARHGVPEHRAVWRLGAGAADCKYG